MTVAGKQREENKSTEQLNLRMPKALLDDIDVIAQILKINKSEWIKIRLGELVYEEKSRLLSKYHELSKKGLLEKKEVDKIIETLYHSP